MHTKITMDVETGRKQDTAENHQGNYSQEWNYKLDISKIKKTRDPNKSNKLQRARILKTNPPIKMQNWKQTIMIKSTENILTDKWELKTLKRPQDPGCIIKTKKCYN